MDVLTLSYVNLFIGFAAALLFTLLYKQDSQQRHLKYWLVAGLCLVVNSVLGIFSASFIVLPYWLLPATANVCTIGIHVFILAGLYQHTRRAFNMHWLLGIILITFAMNLTDFAQQSIANRLLLNFPLIVGLNVAVLRLLCRQPSSGLQGVYLSFRIALSFNIAQLSIRFALVALDMAGIELAIHRTLVYSLGYFCLAAFSMLVFGSCLYLVYRQQHIRLQHTAERDALTGVYNRRMLEQKLLTELQRSARAGQHCSVIMLDIDHFKQINDNYGHMTGDLAICHVASVTQQQLRSYDQIFRYGGEEFLLCLPDTDSSAALHIANRIRKQIAHSTLPACDTISLTVSMGIATYTGGELHWQQLISQADNALYQSKQQGRNQSSHFSQLLAGADSHQ
jgi:diguanylate cyclase (GGDEF)-like protein